MTCPRCGDKEIRVTTTQGNLAKCVCPRCNTTYDLDVRRTSVRKSGFKCIVNDNGNITELNSEEEFRVFALKEIKNNFDMMFFEDYVNDTYESTYIEDRDEYITAYDTFRRNDPDKLHEIMEDWFMQAVDGELYLLRNDKRTWIGEASYTLTEG